MFIIQKIKSSKNHHSEHLTSATFFCLFFCNILLYIIIILWHYTQLYCERCANDDDGIISQHELFNIILL